MYNADCRSISPGVLQLQTGGTMQNKMQNDGKMQTAYYRLLTIFSDVIAPEWPRVVHKIISILSFRDPRNNTHGYWANSAEYLNASALQIVLLCVHAPRGLFRVPFLSHPPPLINGNLYPGALLCMRGIYFRPYLSIFACAIEVQHNNENHTTIHVYRVISVIKC